MRRLIVVFTLLLCATIARAQPDDAPGIAAPDPAGNAPVLLFQEPVDLGPMRSSLNRLNHPAGKVDLSSPESCVRSFVWAVHNRDAQAAGQCIQNALPVAKLRPLENEWRKQQPDYIFLISDLHSYPTRDRATVTLRITFMMGRQDVTPHGTCERFHLRRIGQEWLIVPKPSNKTIEQLQVRLNTEDLLVKLAGLMADQNALTSQTSLAGCQSNLKQIALGVLQRAQDFDQKFPSVADWQNEIRPYLHNEALFLCPDAKENEVSYAFDAALGNKSMAAIEQPSQTIMLYEGKGRKFEFRHIDKTLTNILFADGHVKAFTQPEIEAALEHGEVRWSPQ